MKGMLRKWKWKNEDLLMGNYLHDGDVPVNAKYCV